MHLFHRDLGGAGRPPLVILHGILGSSRNWQTAGDDLSARYHVSALDLRNHGASPHGEPMTYEAMMADVVEWLEAQGVGPATVLGHSMGGKVAMLLACRQPERVARLVVEDIAPKAYPATRHQAEFDAMNALDLATLRSRAEAERALEARVPDWGLRKFLTTNLERGDDGRWRWTINLPVLTQALSELARNPLQPSDQYAGPATFIVGGKSGYVQAEDWAAIVRHFPVATREILPLAGHNPHMEARAAFVQSLLSR
jgi:pimeloyl-ACP methyl ester carboxylesterase